MYTVCYTTKEGHDTFERCEDRQEVAALLIREGLQDACDEVLIFPPEADDLFIDIEDVFAGI